MSGARYCAAALALLSGCRPIPPEQRVFPASGPGPSPEVVLEVWLSKSCSVGEQADLGREMRRIAQILTPKLIGVFEDPNQPASEQTIAVGKYAQEQLAAMKENVNRLGLGELEKNLVRAQTVESYREKAVADYVTNYKSAALSGLGVVNTTEAKKYLNGVAASGRPPYQGLARSILAGISASGQKY